MEANAGGETAGKFTTRKGRLFAGASCAALAITCVLPARVVAANYTASNDAELRGRITQANGDGDPTSTIVLTASFTTNTTSLPAPTKPITIDTGSFTLSGIGGTGGTAGSTINIIGVAGPSDSFTLQGNFKGGDAQAATGGIGIQARLNSTLTNFGTILGGNSTGGAGGTGVDFGGTGTSNTLVNHGTIRGGAGATVGGAGLNVRSNTAPIVNTGTIEGGSGAAAVQGNATFTLTNSGTVQGGAGAVAIAPSAVNASLFLVNSGTIRAGAGQADAIRLAAGSTGLVDLELQAGSLIFGNVVANAAGANDVLRLGGSANASFDVSTIGAAAQYQNFDAFQKVGTGTWSLIGAGTATTNWTIQQGTLQIGNGGASGSIIGNVTNNATLSFNRSNTYTFAGVISGTGAVNQIGAGTTVLTGLNSYGGGTTISSGVLSVSADNNLGLVTGGLTFNGGVLQVTGTSFNGTSRAMTWGAAGGGFDIADAPNNFTVSQSLAGGGPLSKLGAGSLILTANNSYAGGTTISGGALMLGNGGTSGGIAGDVTNNGTLAFNRSDAVTFAGVISGSGAMNQVGTGATVLTGDNSYAGGTTIAAGTLQLGDGGTSGSILGDVLNDGTLAFNRSDAMTFGGDITGSGAIRQIGSGLTELTGDGSVFTGTTSVEAGALAVNGSLCGDLNVRSGGRLQGTGTVCDTSNFAGGTIAPGNSIGTLTVAGNYAGTGGTLEIEAELGGDASPADRLVVTGNTAGTTKVKVIRVGGAGAQTVQGIKVVDVGGTSGGAFTLLGNYLFKGKQAVVGGAYAYQLQKNGVSTPTDGDWYLRSTFINPDIPGDPDPKSLYAPGVPLYEAYAGVLQSLNELDTLQQRIGNRSWGDGATPQGADLPGAAPVDGRAIWGRIEAAHAEFDPEASTSSTDYDVTTWKLQAGVDALLSESSAGALIGGITVHYGKAASDVSSIFGTGSIDATGYGVGGTLTWLGDSGFYVDAQAQATWYDSDLKSTTLGTTLADGNDGFGYGLGIEAGQKVALSNNWSLTPQAQLGYSSVDFDDFADPFGALVSLDDGDQLTGRLGVSADYENQWVDRTGQLSRTHVYGIANLYYDFLDGSKVDVSGVDLISENQALWGGLGGGGTLSWADGRYAIYGEATARTSLEDFGDSYAFGGEVGLKVTW